MDFSCNFPVTSEYNFQVEIQKTLKTKVRASGGIGIRASLRRTKKYLHDLHRHSILSQNSISIVEISFIVVIYKSINDERTK